MCAVRRRPQARPTHVERLWIEVRTGVRFPAPPWQNPQVFWGFCLFQGLGCPLGYPLLRASCAQGARLEVSGGRRCGYLCALSGRCALVSGQMGSGIPGRSAESSPAWIMSLCSEGLCGVARSLIPGWRMRCTPGYVSGVSSLAGWRHDHLDGEGAVGTDYTGCRQRVIRHAPLRGRLQ